MVSQDKFRIDNSRLLIKDDIRDTDHSLLMWKVVYMSYSISAGRRAEFVVYATREPRVI